MYFCRPERAHDVDAIRVVLETAFPSAAEARLVDALRGNGRLVLSIVACDGAGVVGHVAFSPVEAGTASGLGLAPMAVLPGHQNKGVGAMLVREGLATCAAQGCGFVVVLGEPEYYGRFGFEHSPTLGVEGVPAEAFFALAFDGPLPQGTVSFHPAFDLDR